MGCYKIGTECCNNCYHWECHADRRLRGNPPSEVYTDSNLDKCDISGKTTRSDEVCGMFRHLGGVTKTFALEKKPERDIGGEFATALAEFTQDMNSIRAASTIASSSVEEKFDHEEQARIQKERNRTIERSSELLRAKIDPLVFAKNDLDRAVEFMHLYDAASGGDAEAQYELYKALWDGERGARKDRLRANAWLKDAANGGCVDAQVKKAEERFECESVGAWEQGLEWYEKADRGGDRGVRIARCKAMVKVAKCYLEGKNYAPLDFPKGVEILKQAITLGSKDAEELLEQSKNELESARLTVDRIIADAENGEASSQDKLGMIYARYPSYKKYGCCVPCNYEKSFEWFSKAADQGLGVAMYHLAMCYKDGEGVAKDVQKAAHWFERSAKAENKYGMYEYGLCLLCEEDEKDKLKGLLLIVQSAMLGYALAAKKVYKTAKYGEGPGRIVDSMVAFEFCALAANGGNADCMADLSYMYSDGFACEKDASKASEWLKKAYDAGYSGW